MSSKPKTDKRTGGVCKGCGVYIEWIRTKKGKNMPVEPDPINIITEEGETIEGFIPHWATCSSPNQFRKNE